MKRSEQNLWRSARTLADLGELTARWLEGSVKAHPGYDCRPERETRPLVPVLARLNRAGFITTQSQPGWRHRNGSAQRANVEGIVADWDTAEMLWDSFGPGLEAGDPDDGTGIHVGISWVDGWSSPLFPPARTLITLDGGDPFTWSGPPPSPGELDVDDRLCDEAKLVLSESLYVWITDLEWGRNDLLWPALDTWALSTASATCGGAS